MPIKPENKDRYPKNWKEIRERILERAKHACEQCGVLNHMYGYRRTDGLFLMTGFNEKLAMVWPSLHEFIPLPPWAKEIEIILTIAHLDHTPENCGDDNLKALCQRCHLRYDIKHHMGTARATRHKRKLEDYDGKDLFTEGTTV